MKRLIAGALVAGGVAIFAGVGAFGDDTVRDTTGSIVEGGGIGAFVIQTGDCLNIPDGDLVQSVEGVPCSQEHDAEAYYTFDLADGSYPGPDWVSESAFNGCLGAFHPFVGLAYEYSELDIYWLEPTEESWTQIDDREITCMVVTLDGSKLTGSMRGAGR
jgi:Septum formation